MPSSARATPVPPRGPRELALPGQRPSAQTAPERFNTAGGECINWRGQVKGCWQEKTIDRVHGAILREFRC